MTLRRQSRVLENERCAGQNEIAINSSEVDMTTRSFLAALCVALLAWEVQPLLCQAGSYAMGSAVPLESWSIAGRRMGGVSVALAEEVPNVFANPANLASLDRPQIFLSLNNARRDFTVQIGRAHV